MAGGTVGAGIIGLPVKTYRAGFVPSVAGLTVCWILLYFSGCLLLELSIWFGEESNMSSMAGVTLGNIAKIACVGMYLFVSGASLVAYIAEAPNFILPVLEFLTGRCKFHYSSWSIIYPRSSYHHAKVVCAQEFLS